MSVLPSPVPHPLDFSPWDVPGWVHDALGWVVGAEWPDGDERAVWDLADRWYGVATVLAGPYEDAAAAANEVRGSFGGAAATAFDTAWRRLAEGGEAPLPVLVVVATDLGRMVEECGCDIEAAKLEVWIELGILVVELMALAVAVVLTAGAASPAAAAAIAASRMVVQQIFRRLVAQLARKSLKQGVREAGERAAKQVSESGARRLARRAALGGLAEAGEEAGAGAAIQGYQNSTGRRHGMDLADIGTSALGGFAGGAAAPLAGLGRHAAGRLGRVGEHFSREMGGEVLAETAASLATGGGLISLEDAARAAVSGATGSATTQADRELQARLEGRLSALAGTSGVPVAELPSDLPPAVDAGGSGRPPPGVDQLTQPGEDGADRTRGGAVDTTPHLPSDGGGSLGPHGGSPERHQEPSIGGAPAPVVPNGAGQPAPPPLPLVGTDAGPALDTGVPPVVSAAPDRAGVSPMLSSVGTDVPVTTPATLADGVHAAVTTTGPGVGTSSGGSAAYPQPVSPGPSTPVIGAGPVVQAAPVSVDGPAVQTAPISALAGNNSSATTAQPSAGEAGTPATAGTPRPQPSHGAGTVPSADPPAPRFPLLEALDPGPPRQRSGDDPVPPGPDLPRRRTPRMDDERRAAEREALERRRYQGHLRAQREWYEDNRRRDETQRLRAVADDHETRSRRLAIRASTLRRSGDGWMAERTADLSRRALLDSFHYRDLAEAVLEGRVLPSVVDVATEADFHRINNDVAELAVGAVETADRSALTGDDDPPPIDWTRRYGVPGGLRPPLALHQTDIERAAPRGPDGTPARTADPRSGTWFKLVNDGGPEADATRGINCLDCTLSLYETWVHGRPRVAAPRTFDSYEQGDVLRPRGGEIGGPGRVESVTGGRFQRVCPDVDGLPAVAVRQVVDGGYAHVHAQLLAGGHGSYAFLVTSYQGGGSHAWVALNQNGTILYLDPQSGAISNRPLYGHSGQPGPANVVGIDALVLGADGEPLPMRGLPPGRFTTLPEPADVPPALVDEIGDEHHLDRMHPLDAPAGGPASAGPTAADGPGQSDLRQARDQAYAIRQATGTTAAAAVAAAPDLDAVFLAGVSPVELAAELDPTTVRRLAPYLDEPAAQDVARLLADPRVRGMLDQAWTAPPCGEPMLAETLVRQLVERTDLVRMILATPELANSLTARPLTLHHLASHQQAIDVLGSVLDDIAERGPEAVIAEETPKPKPTPLTDEQRAISAEVGAVTEVVRQPGFDASRRHDERYRLEFLRELYDKAAEAQGELNALAVSLAGTSGRPGWRTEPKGLARVLDKLVEYENDVSRLKDLAAAKIEFDRIDDLYEALRRLGREPGVVVMDKVDRFVSPQRSGYRDVLMRLRMSNGHVAELRLHLAALDDVAMWEHSLYEIRRDLKAAAEAENRPLTATERAIYDGLLRREQRVFWDALRGALGGSE